MPANPTYQDSDFTSAIATSAFVKETAFDGVATRLVGRQNYRQDRDSYTETALGTPHPDDPDWLLTKEDNFQDLGGNIIEWTRTYAKIPERRVEGRAVAWTLPGLGASGTIALRSVTTVATSGNTVTITTAAAHNLSAGDFAVIYFGRTADTSFLQAYTFAQVQSAPDTTTVTFLLNALPVLAQTNARAIQKVSQGNYTARVPEQQTVRGFVVYDYFASLDGVQDTDGNVIEIFTPPVIRDDSGAVTDTYTSGSTPTLAQYQAKIDAAAAANITFQDLLDNDALVVSQASAVRRWLGNIWERETEYVAAQ